MRKLAILSAVFTFGISLFFSLSPTASALSGTDFKAGRIIDDQVFYNSTAMTAAEIQTFLEAKVPICDTNGEKIWSGTQTRAQYGATRGNPAPYVCLKDYTEQVTDKIDPSGNCGYYSGGYRTAAEIIYNAAQACGINPQVLLVLLQKEQSLITDDWPWSSQYSRATGFGCPDTVDCNAEILGFSNQIYSAAHYFRRYANNPNDLQYKVGQVSQIQYHPNSACGSSGVLIENKATGSLYQYTPYQPNAASLNNLYGTGDMCSAYGNRNFWRMFSDWFGSTRVVNPTVDLDANISGRPGETTVQSGTPLTLSWTSQDAINCQLSPLDYSGREVSIAVTPLQTTTYTVTCWNATGSATDSISITVLPNPTASLNVNANLAYGDTATITWSSSHTENCTLNSDALSSTNGSKQEIIFASKTYTLTCTGQYGSATASTSVTVNPVTFAYLNNAASNLQATKGNLASLQQAITSAEKSLIDGDKAQVTKKLQLATDNLNKQIQQGKVSASEAANLSRALQDMLQLLAS